MRIGKIEIGGYMKRIEEPKQTFIATCKKSGCGSKWKLTEEDIIKEKITKRNKCTINHYGFICPDCNHFTELDLPEKIKYKAKLCPGQVYEPDNDFEIGNVIEIETIDSRKIVPIRCNDWCDSMEDILYSLCGCRDDRIYPTVLSKTDGFMTIGFRTPYLSDNYYVFKVPIMAITAKRIDFDTDIHKSVELKDQSYFYIDEDDKYVYVLVFYYYSYRDFVKAMYQNIPYEKIKDPKKYWFNQSLKSPADKIPYEKCYITLNDVFGRGLISKINKEDYYRIAVPIFDFCECLDIEEKYIKYFLAKYIADFGTDKVVDV